MSRAFGVTRELGVNSLNVVIFHHSSLLHIAPTQQQQEAYPLSTKVVSVVILCPEPILQYATQR